MLPISSNIPMSEPLTSTSKVVLKPLPCLMLSIAVALVGTPNCFVISFVPFLIVSNPSIILPSHLLNQLQSPKYPSWLHLFQSVLPPLEFHLRISCHVCPHQLLSNL